MLKRVLATFIFLLALPTSAATLSEQVQAARKSGNWSAVVETLRGRAEAGDALSQSALGQMYVAGLGVAPDAAKALALFQRAAEQNFAPAHSFVGFFYGVGLAVPKNSQTALLWYLKAAEQGVSEAQYNVGLMHNLGEAGTRDDAKAREWYEKAAAQGFAMAWTNLGALQLGDGRSPPKDLGNALALMRQAADAGVTAAQINLAMLHLRGGSNASDPIKAYYYALLAASDDPRGPCVPSMVWAAARLEQASGFSEALVIREELARQSCMKGNPVGKQLVKAIEKGVKEFPDIEIALRGARKAAENWLENRKVIDEPPEFQLLKTGLGNNAGEWGFLRSPAKWVLLRLNERDGDKVISEMRPEGDVGENWLQNARYEVARGRVLDHPKKHLETTLQTLRDNCSELFENKVFDGEERGFPTYVMNTYCNQTKKESRSEMHFFKVVQGEATLYAWHATWRGATGAMFDQAEATREVIMSWSIWLKNQVVCVVGLASGAKVCPPGYPLQAPTATAASGTG